ncbi:OLC1v1022413C1 [Oldenlandia corymbosa var. corymbosa]|uniref:peptidylprolyl isomerase n=1 Tax=Oldenlandia corymbosa var. corymbosa TaxID=529605 RepID=A0AAV1BXZ6_OLDCO|nr:OLC1v1022413C1 [Oldenlandia corymbosa var. corymbosa]
MTTGLSSSSIGPFIHVEKSAMAAPASQTHIHSPLISASRWDVADQCRVVMAKKFEQKGACLTNEKVRRRSILQSIVFAPIFANADLILAAPNQDMKEPDVIRTLKLASGVRIQEIVEGNGPEVHGGDVVEVNYVCRRSNGYFVHSTVDQFSGESAPVILALDDKQVIEGLKEVLIGMKAGGKRRALIPPSVGYISENLVPIPVEFGPRRSLLSHAKEPLIFEVQLLKIL